ncbi:MAG: right-handed parallel beta-helix repeat-containing protein, partial [Armatimonadetes bacterium]|nr:right-handed parallel beta-helix repeat-containing protein [Armatimonadota bacterium]
MQSSLADTVYVSPSGSDGAAGTRGAPVRTISQALSRRANRIVLEAGLYRIEAPITIGPESSGLTIEADAGAHPVVTSAERLRLVWRRWQGGVYRASVPTHVRAIDSLWVAGRHEVLARYPNFDADAPYLNGASSSALSADRAARWSDPRGAIVHAMQQGLWGDEWFEITGKSPDGEPLLSPPWGNNRPSPPHPNYRYVEGLLEELDAPGEWYFDAARHFLYYYPHIGMDLATADVEASESAELFHIDGGAGGTVRGVTLSGLSFERTARSFRDTREPLLRSDWEIARRGVVVLENTDGCRIDRCRFVDVGSNGVFVSGRNHRAVVSGCLFQDVGASGICFVGRPTAVRSPLFHYSERLALDQVDPTPGPRGDAYPMECMAQDCLMLRTGRVELQSAGVEISMARRITVDHCTIRDVPRAGINIGDGCWGGDLIENCDVSDTVLESSDHGAFNSWGRDRYWGVDFAGKPMPPGMPEWDTIEPNVLRHNRFQCAHGWDIDLDDGSSNYVIEDNLCMQGGLKLREGYDRTVRNNLILFN